ncbi:MAG TPA: acyl-CoA dehydrogenase family protein [Polyangiaceae bacterium]|jgi:butyryl-CoA dehydrogenase|nr:acyl-CoA dehydrogenase family protein [Polyangiaceae bacterium]
MNYDLSEDQALVLQTARDFARREVEPKAAELDKEARWPAEIIAQMADLGFLGMAIPTEYGGAGLDHVSYALVVEEISRACASTGVIMSVNNSLFCDPVYKFGTEEQKQRVLTPTASGQMLGAFGLTEPSSGSDARTMKTLAEATGDGGFVLNGAKNWITNGPHAEHILVFAISTPDPVKPKHTAMLVRRGTPGFSCAAPDHKLGIHAAHSATIFFENVKVAKEDIVGGAGEGFKVAMSTLDGGRIGIAAQAVGIAQAALDKAAAYAKERTSFGGPIANHQAIQFMLADMATEVEAARLLVLRAAAMKDKKQKHTAESSMAKLFASEVATKVAHKALQIHGGYGYSSEYALERHYRDARITEIYEGTSEIQRIVVAASLLRG